jgi:hypothetical protein
MTTDFERLSELCDIAHDETKPAEQLQKAQELLVAIDREQLVQVFRSTSRCPTIAGLTTADREPPSALSRRVSRCTKTSAAFGLASVWNMAFKSPEKVMYSAQSSLIGSISGRRSEPQLDVQKHEYGHC